MNKSLPSPILANAVGSDGRSRLRYKPSGGSERFHALHPKPPIGCHNGVFACDQHNLIKMRVKPRPSGRGRKARSDIENVAAMAD